MLAESAWCELSRLLPGQVRAGEPMSSHTSWRIGGPADVFVDPADIEDLRLTVYYAYRQGIPLTVIGAGTNLLVSEEGIRGIVVKVGHGLGRISTVGNEIVAGGGAKLAGVAVTARDTGLGGVEFSAGIPGTVGGAVIMNAGANGSSISTLVREVTLLDFTGVFSRKSKEEMHFGYRTSILQREPAIVVEVCFSCHPRNKKAIREEMEKYIARRRLTQPLGLPSAGSVFKNPPGDSAGRLIEAAGLKGLRFGDAQVSGVHANFIVNLGAASARDVLALIDRVREAVYGRFGVELQLEVKVVGGG